MEASILKSSGGSIEKALRTEGFLSFLPPGQVSGFNQPL